MSHAFSTPSLQNSRWVGDCGDGPEGEVLHMQTWGTEFWTPCPTWKLDMAAWACNRSWFRVLVWDRHAVAFICGRLTESSFESHQVFIIGFILQVGQPRGRMASWSHRGIVNMELGMNLRQSFLHDPLGLVEGLSHPGHLMGTLSLNLQSCTSVQERDKWGWGGESASLALMQLRVAGGVKELPLNGLVSWRKKKVFLQWILKRNSSQVEKTVF